MDLGTIFHHPRRKKITDCYIFTQMVYTVPPAKWSKHQNWEPPNTSESEAVQITTLHTFAPTSTKSTKTIDLVRKLEFDTTNSTKSRNHQYETFVTASFWSRHVFGLTSTRPDRKVLLKLSEYFRPSSEWYETSSEFQTSTVNCVSYYHR